MLSIAGLTSSALLKDSTMFVAGYFRPLNFCELEKFNLLTSHSRISVAIAKDILHPRREEYGFAMMSRMEFIELLLLH